MRKAEEGNACMIGFDSLCLVEMEEVKEMCRANPLSPSIFQYVLGVLKGSCTLGEAAAQARQFENEMNAWMDGMEDGRIEGVSQ